MKELTLSAVVENIEIVTDFVNEYLDAQGCSMKTQMQIAVVIDEVFSNISYYAYAPFVGEVTVRIEVLDDSKRVMLVFADGGVPYNPLTKEDPDITASPDEMQIGGMGIFMMKRIMDEITYEYVDGKNVLKMWKQI